MCLTDKLSSTKRRKVSRENGISNQEPKVHRRKSHSFTHSENDKTPTRDEPIEPMDIIDNRKCDEKSLRERLSSNEGQMNESIKIKSKWGGDTSDEDDDQNKQIQNCIIPDDPTPDPGILGDLYDNDDDNQDQNGMLGPESTNSTRLD